ncbi:MAG: AbrB/MazE/SpoVT family DNA-binding domain-containing protein [Spirochaetes bacterium]|nr:AbrB/MazE/SpoVT family DNA-binding domain-containing protein [Spirochaetota bacterium]
MVINIVKIGNSKGIRLPKTILEQCNINNKVDLEIEGKKIVIKPIIKNPRQNWDKHFQNMHNNNEDNLIIDDTVDLNMDDWEW